MLILYKPWLKSYEEIMTPHNTYREALLEFMWDVQFPRSILINILQCKYNIDGTVDLAEASDLGLVNEEQQEEYREVVGTIDEDVNIIATPDGETERDYDQGDLLDNDVDKLDLGNCSFNWNANKNMGVMVALTKHTLLYYTSGRNRENIDHDIILNNDDIHRP